MPPVSPSQRRAAAAALSAKRGGRPTSSLSGPAHSMSGMSERQLRDFARKPRPTTHFAGVGPQRSKTKKGRRK